MTSNSFDSDDLDTAPEDLHLPVPRPPAEPAGGVLVGQDRKARLDALFTVSGPPDLSCDEDSMPVSAGAMAPVRDHQRQLLAFSLGSEEYALDIELIREIIKPREITEIPRVADHVLGILSLRGLVIPVYDLKQRLRLGRSEPHAGARIIVCQCRDLVVGLLVDAITQVVKISRDGVEPTPAHMTGVDRNLLLGVGRCQGRFLILLNLPSLIEAELS